MHNHDRLKIKAMKLNDPHDWANFKRMRNKVNTEIKAAKELCYNNKFIEANGGPHKAWQIINDLKFRKAANPSIREINLNGISISESPDLSNAFNDHFSSIGLIGLITMATVISSMSKALTIDSDFTPQIVNRF